MRIGNKSFVVLIEDLSEHKVDVRPGLNIFAGLPGACLTSSLCGHCDSALHKLAGQVFARGNFKRREKCRSHVL